MNGFLQLHPLPINYWMTAQRRPVPTFMLCSAGALMLSCPPAAGRLRLLALGLPHLTDLQLNNCGEMGLVVLHCPALERLSMQVGVGGCCAGPLVKVLSGHAS